MPTFTIPAGAHYHRVPPFLCLPWAGKRSIHRRITFSDSCQYDSPLYNSEDVNKLFGITFGVLPRQVDGKWVGPGHWNSARFGWVWSAKYQQWKLMNYCYLEGRKNWDEQLRFPEVARVSPGMTVDCFLDYHPATGMVEFRVYQVLGQHSFSLLGTSYQQLPKNLPAYGLQMGPYFGGHLVAPHTMKLGVARIK